MVGSQTPLNADETRDLVLRQRITDIRVVRYFHQGEQTGDEGPVETHLGNGAVVLFECGGDGEEMTMKRGAWEDPFAGEQPGENLAFIRDYGKWTRVAPEHTTDLRSQVVGAVVDEVSFEGTRQGKTTGAALSLGNRVLRVRADRDELRISLDVPSGS
ncbi:hypothetical protein FHX37_2808 [Haloactinospora alba]|uniref:Uncharacterized protein n=1 Tax=Haloactinospora alba TaxID=405555 RepID=A0A543NLZ2_9ACTN|nr:hypothetical protein [Haloactinospora alba]TQN32824.1 hypothetical protein FHX37_2808 [Haloactinospora alba]